MGTAYDVLGVRPDADDQQIRAAFRALVKAFHPDLHPGDRRVAREFRKIVAAHDVLKSRERRAAYDARLRRDRARRVERRRRTIRGCVISAASSFVIVSAGTLAFQSLPPDARAQIARSGDLAQYMPVRLREAVASFSPLPARIFAAPPIAGAPSVPREARTSVDTPEAAPDALPDARLRQAGRSAVAPAGGSPDEDTFARRDAVPADRGPETNEGARAPVRATTPDLPQPSAPGREAARADSTPVESAQPDLSASRSAVSDEARIESVSPGAGEAVSVRPHAGGTPESLPAAPPSGAVSAAAAPADAGGPAADAASSAAPSATRTASAVAGLEAVRAKLIGPTRRAFGADGRGPAAPQRRARLHRSVSRPATIEVRVWAPPLAGDPTAALGYASRVVTVEREPADDASDVVASFDGEISPEIAALERRHRKARAGKRVAAREHPSKRRSGALLPGPAVAAAESRRHPAGCRCHEVQCLPLYPPSATGAGRWCEP
jgi:curved DNA-binding protein CbpA